MNVVKNTEIEIRGKLDKKIFRKIFSQLKKTGKLTDHYKRLSVDLSPGFDPKSRSWKSDNQIDIRIKKSGNTEKISLKIGEVHAKERQEIEVRLKEGELLNSISLLENLSFNKGMIYFWESWEFEYKGYEIKLSKYTDNYFTWEIETTNHKLYPYDLANSLNLAPFTKQGYNRAIDWENKNIHKIYSYNLVEKLIKEFSN